MPLTEINLTGGPGQAKAANLPFTSDPVTIRTSYEWSIIFNFDGVDADPIISVEGSNDEIEFTNIASEITSTPRGVVTPVMILLTKSFSDPINGVNSVKAETFPFKWLRINYDPNGATSGTVTALLALMVDE